ncbi:FAD-binding protein [Actinokineospora sp. NPDC004072]
MGVGRRRFLVAGAAAVVAFDPVGLRWAAQASPGAIAVPDLDGELLTDPAALAEAADDYGQIVHRSPRAVLRPGSTADVVRMVRFANRHRIPVAVRGQGHSTFGQAQSTGVVIDSRPLSGIEIRGTTAVVGAGATWGAVTDAALARGLTPPVATDYLGLSVGGTLSVGGIGGASHHHGLHVDTVQALEVVTGTGELVRCGPGDRLFEAVLGGLGQYALIVRAWLDLVPAASTARVYKVTYRRLGELTAAQRIAVGDGRFSYVEGQVVPVDGGWAYVLEAASYHDTAPDDAALLAGLPAGAVEITDLPYRAWLNRVTDVVDQIRPLKLPNPWVNLFLPDTATDAFVARALSRLTPAEVGAGPILLYPVPRARLTRPMVRVPGTDLVFLLSILRALPADQAAVRALVADNRALYEDATAIGATQYPIGSIPMRRPDWRAHYGSHYPRARTAKSHYDPRGILTPGQGVFG